MRSILIMAVATAASLFVGVSALHAERLPTAGRADPRIKTVVYRHDDVVRITASYGISTMLIFGDGERIETFSMGDAAAWQPVPNDRRNILFVKPVERDADTNLNVVTNKRVYFLYLEATDRDEGGKTFGLRFIYPEEEYNARLLNEARERARYPNIKNIDKDNVNLDYSYTGGEALKPSLVFDDGVKTFFQFRGDVPAIFMVGPDRSETPVNFRREGDYIVVDRTARQWTLRNGKDYTCLFNLRKSDPGAPELDPLGPKKARSGGLFGRSISDRR